MTYQEKYAQAKKAGLTESQNYQIKGEWGEGEMVIGRLKDITTVHFQENDREADGYVFDTDDGLIQFTLGAGVDTQMKDRWKIGGLYAITYRGRKTLSGSRSLKLFDIELIQEGE